MLQNLKEVLKEMMDQLSSIQNDVKEIKEALLGTPFNPVGIIKRLEVVEVKVEKVISKTNRRIWIERGIMLTVTVIWTVVIALIK